MSTPAPSYSLYRIQSFLPVVGWQAVSLTDTGHEAWPIRALARVQEHRDAHRTQDRLPGAAAWEIAAVISSPRDGWRLLCLEDVYCCGLLPPGDTLDAFLAEHTCSGNKSEPSPSP